MRKLAALDRQYHLAVSLHAPTEALRNELVPINEKVGLDAVIEAADAYFQRSGRQVTFEYVLLRGVNDRPEDAAALARLAGEAQGARQPDPVQPGRGLALRAARRPRRSGGSWRACGRAGSASASARRRGARSTRPAGSCVDGSKAGRPRSQCRAFRCATRSSV